MQKRKKVRNRFIQIFFDHYIRKTIRQHQPKLVFVTGSIGKTSTRYLIANMLSYRYRVYSEVENNNAGNPMRASFFGIDLPHHRKSFEEWREIFADIHSKTEEFPYDVVVLELAESKYKKLQHFVDMVHPDYAVVTSIAPAHLGTSFKDGGMKEVQRGTWSIVRNSKKIYYNREFKYSRQYAKAHVPQAITYGNKSAATKITRSDRHPDTGTLQITVRHQGQSLKLETNFVSKQTCTNLLPAIAIAKDMGMSNQDIQESVRKIFPVPGRMQRLIGKDDSIVLDDTYNANPVAMSAALDTLGEFSAYKRIAVLGNMNSLGQHAAKAYRQVAEHISQNCDQLILFCDESIEHFVPALKKVKSAPDILTFKGSKEVGKYLAAQDLSQTAILFKGSEGDVYTEEAIKFLVPQPASRKLVRQNTRWKNKKDTFFKDLEMEHGKN